MFNKIFSKVKEIMGKNKNKNKSSGTKKNISNAVSKVEELKETTQRGPMKLRFSPTAWSKLLFLRDIGDTEVGGFGITLADDLLYVNDFILIKQECSSVTVEFDDDNVADFMMDMVEAGLKPEQFMRIWIHTHPNMSASPSLTDEKTFARVFGKCDWAVMAILSTSGDQYCRLQVNGGPFPGAFEIPMEVDFSTYDFDASDSQAYLDEHTENVTEVTFSNYYPSYPDNKKYTETYKGTYRGPYSADKSSHMSFEGGSEIIHLGGDDIELPPDWDYTEDSEGFGFIEPDMEFHTSIPQDILDNISPNDMSLLESMNSYERAYVLDNMKKKFGIGD